MSIGWKLHEGTLGPDEVVAPDEGLSWPKTVGLGAQHVVAMFGEGRRQGPLVPEPSCPNFAPRRKLMMASGTAVLNAPFDQVWAAFDDPAVGITTGRR